jgi:hypothetical protein
VGSDSIRAAKREEPELLRASNKDGACAAEGERIEESNRMDSSHIIYSVKFSRQQVIVVLIGKKNEREDESLKQ